MWVFYDNIINIMCIVIVIIIIIIRNMHEKNINGTLNRAYRISYVNPNEWCSCLDARACVCVCAGSWRAIIFINCNHFFLLIRTIMAIRLWPDERKWAKPSPFSSEKPTIEIHDWSAIKFGAILSLQTAIIPCNISVFIFHSPWGFAFTPRSAIPFSAFSLEVDSNSIDFFHFFFKFIFNWWIKNSIERRWHRKICVIWWQSLWIDTDSSDGTLFGNSLRHCLRNASCSVWDSPWIIMF